MKHKKPILCTAVCTFLLIAFLIIPVNGKESDCYTLQISLRMICDKSGTEAPLDSLDSSFYLLNADNQYLTGVYQDEIQSYVITGTADNSPMSTVFQVKPESPGLIRVTGLSEGNYVLKEHYVNPKYTRFIEDIPVEISRQGALVLGKDVPFVDNTVTLSIEHFLPFQLPILYNNEDVGRTYWSVTTLLLIIGGILIFNFVLSILRSRDNNLSLL